MAALCQCLVLIDYPAAVLAVIYGFYDGRGRVFNFAAFTLVLFEGTFVALAVSGGSPSVVVAAVIVFVAVGYSQVRRFRSGSPAAACEAPPGTGSQGDRRFRLEFLPPTGNAQSKAALRGDTYCYMGEFDKAVAEYTEAIRLDPQNAGAYFGRGFAYEKEGDNAKAEEDFAQAKRLGYKEA